jgi:hypothetical protein
MWRTVSAALCAIAVGLAANLARAQIAVPLPIEAPIPDQLRTPFEKFLRELGATDPGATIDKTRAFPISSIWHLNSVLLRIEDAKFCREDLCLTLIGRVIESEFRADAMFNAGKGFTGGDQFVQLFGFQTLPRWLVGDKMTSTLLETPKGRIVVTVENQKTSPP